MQYHQKRLTRNNTSIWKLIHDMEDIIGSVEDETKKDVMRSL